MKLVVCLLLYSGCFCFVARTSSCMHRWTGHSVHRDEKLHRTTRLIKVTPLLCLILFIKNVMWWGTKYPRTGARPDKCRQMQTNMWHITFFSTNCRKKSYGAKVGSPSALLTATFHWSMGTVSLRHKTPHHEKWSLLSYQSAYMKPASEADLHGKKITVPSSSLTNNSATGHPSHELGT